MLKYSVERYPKISVITVVYNRKSFIERAITSLIEQKYPNVEYLVLDGGSTDGTTDVIAKYQSHVSYFRSRKDLGAAAAVNEGIKNSTGEIIALLNSDDYFEPNALIKIAEEFIEHPEAEIVSFLGRVNKLNKDGSMNEGELPDPRDLEFVRWKLNKLYTVFRFYKKSLYDKYGYYVESVNGRPAIANDYEHILRLSMYDIKSRVLNFHGYTCIAHEGSNSFNTRKYTKLVVSEEKVFYIHNLLEKYHGIMEKDFEMKLRYEMKRASIRTVVKNIIDRNFRSFVKNIWLGVKEFGFLYFFKVLDYFLSYQLRLNKIIRKIKRVFCL